MALDTLEIFGDEYTNVKGFKATDDNGTTLAYIRPQGTKTITTNGTGIDVSEYANVDVNVSSGTQPTQTKSVSPTESAQTVTPDSGYLLSSVNVGAISSTYVGSGITRRDDTDLSVSGAIVTVPAGYYTEQQTKSVAIGTAGTPSAQKGTVSNHSINVTSQVTNTEGYITGGIRAGYSVTVSASELVSGSETKTENGTYDVTNLASLVVDVPIVTYYTGSSAPTASLGSDGDIYLQTS